MPFILPAIAAGIAALTITEIIVIAAVIAIGVAYATSRNLNGVMAAPPIPGTAYVTNPLQLTLSNDAPRRMAYGKVRISGVIAYWNISGAGYEYLTMVVIVAAHPIQGITNIYFDGVVGDTAAPGFYNWRYYDGTQTTADAEMQATFPEWTPDCILTGCAYAIVRLRYDKVVWQNGRPNIQFDVLGKKVYDPRTGQTAWSNNAALCVMDYITSPDGLEATSAEVDWATVSAAADICAQLPDGMAASMCDGRYTVDGVVELTSRNGDVITAMLAAAAGTVIWSEGQYRLFVGAARAPVARAITDEDLNDDFALQPRMPADQTFNGVKGTFLDATNNWIFTDFPPISSAGYVAADGGTKVFKDIVLQFTTSPMTAQRLATIFLRRARLEKTITLKCKWTCFNYEVWDVVKLTLPQLAWVDKKFQITDWKMTPPSREEPGGIELTMMEYDDAIYSDVMDLKPITPGGTVLVPNVTVPRPPAALFASSGPGTMDAEGHPRVRFDWAVVPDIYAVGYELAFGLAPFTPADADYIPISGRSSFTYMSPPFPAGNSYIGYLRVINSFGLRSAVTASNVVVTRAVGSEYPEGVANLTATLPTAEAVDLTWSAPSQGTTTARAAQVEVRWAPTNLLSDAVLVTRFAVGPTSTRLVRELSDGYYFVGYLSTGGLYGPFASVASPGRTATGTVLRTLGLSRVLGDLVNGVWYGSNIAVTKSQALASALGWEVFDQMVPSPFLEMRYFAKVPTYAASGLVLRVTGTVGRSRAPGLPGTLPVVNASAEVAYFASTVYKQGSFTLTEDANVKIGFIATHAEPQGVVVTAFNGTLEQL